MSRLLFQRYPDLEKELPWVKIVDLPTPVEPLEKLREAAGLADAWIKRDDISGPIYGGNKPRKLEFIFGDVIKKGKREVITAGGTGSNHCLAVSLLGKELGLATTMVAVPQKPLASACKNLLTNHFIGTRIVHVKSEPGLVLASVTETVKRLMQTGSLPYPINLGGSTRLGNVGFIEAALELAEQIKNGQMPCPKYIFAPTGSGGSHAGLEIGLRLAGLPTRVVGVRVSERLVTNRPMLMLQSSLTVKYLRRKCEKFPDVKIPASQFILLDDFFGDAYGEPTKEGMAAIDLLDQTEGVKLDPVYSGKAMAGMLAFVKQHGLEKETLLFWNTYSSRDISGYMPQNPDLSSLPEELLSYTKPVTQ